MSNSNIVSISTPRAMQNSIWTRPEMKSTKKRWEFSRKHQKNKLIHIGLVSQRGGKFFLQGLEFPTFDSVKTSARNAGFNQIRMGAIKVTLS
jgi:hypothetical protein